MKSYVWVELIPLVAAKARTDDILLHVFHWNYLRCFMWRRIRAGQKFHPRNERCRVEALVLTTLSHFTLYTNALFQITFILLFALISTLLTTAHYRYQRTHQQFPKPVCWHRLHPIVLPLVLPYPPTLLPHFRVLVLLLAGPPQSTQPPPPPPPRSLHPLPFILQPDIQELLSHALLVSLCLSFDIIN